MPPRRRKRLDAGVFNLPVEELKEGRYTDRYSVRARETLIADGRSPKAFVQVSCTRDAFIGGIDEAIAVLRLCADDWSALTVHALYEGDRVDAFDTVMTIEGPYEQFAHLDTVYLGVLTRGTGIVTSMRAIVDAARPKPVIFFPARQDHWRLQPGDGFAALVAGAAGVSTLAQSARGGNIAVETVSHSLIAAYGGDTVKATQKLAERIAEDAQLIALVDYRNDSATTSVAVARALEQRLWGVRLDTPDTIVDKSILSNMGAFVPTGVNPQLVWNVRNALDAEGFGDVKIVVSGSLTREKIAYFEEEGVPVDAYMVGGALLDERIDFVADVVSVDGKTQAKAGRERRENERMERVK